MDSKKASDNTDGEQSPKIVLTSVSQLPHELTQVISEVDGWTTLRRATALTVLMCIYKHGKPPSEQLELINRPREDDVGKLVKYGVLGHLWIVDTHKESLNAVFDLVSLVVPEKMSKIAQLVKEHDLSKYSECEVFGYTHRWVHYVDSDLWKVACNHHITTNTHHPQAFAEGEDMPEEDVLESVVDMLGCRYERNITTVHISISELVLTEEFFLQRYTPKNRDQVRQCYTQWKEKLLKLYAENRAAFEPWEKKYNRPIVE